MVANAHLMSLSYNQIFQARFGGDPSHTGLFGRKGTQSFRRYTVARFRHCVFPANGITLGGRDCRNSALLR